MVKYKVSKIINAPIKYVFDWATDYSPDDNLISKTKWPRLILFKGRTKVIYASYKQGSDRKPKLAVRIVTLFPSKFFWHLDYYAEEDLEQGEYRLVRLGPTKTRLDMKFENTWKKGKGPSSKEFEKGTVQVWEKYSRALESDFRSGKKARA